MAELQCQKCRTPLQIDGSLRDLNPASFKLLADAAPDLELKSPGQPQSAAARERQQRYDDAIQQSEASPNKRTVGSKARGSEKSRPPEMSYIMLTDSHILPGVSDQQTSPPGRRETQPPKDLKMVSKDSTRKPALSEQMETMMRLFEILSARSDIDHPICSECTEMLLESLHKRQTSVVRERDAYVDFLKQAQSDISTEDEKIKVKRDLEDAKEREKVALKELEALELEKAQMEEEIALLDAESERLDEEEESFWRDRNAFTSELRALQEQRDSLTSQLAHDAEVLEALQRTNVFNDAFCIAHDGSFATINGLRLGRLPDQTVEWAEINAALGQTVLLLTVVADKVDCKFKEHTLVAVGSTSKIVVEEHKHAQGTGGKAKVHELYSSGDLPLGLGGLFSGKFDNAMVELLSCLRQLGEHVTRKAEGGALLPYKIDKDRIGDVSVRLGYGHDEQWTRACKYILTCCKFLLAHASHVDDARRSGR